MEADLGHERGDRESGLFLLLASKPLESRANDVPVHTKTLVALNLHSVTKFENHFDQ
jgi:hypothetical protein